MSELENSIFVKVFRPISEKSGGLQPPKPNGCAVPAVRDMMGMLNTLNPRT